MKFLVFLLKLILLGMIFPGIIVWGILWISKYVDVNYGEPKGFLFFILLSIIVLIICKFFGSDKR
jgi:hypothetical protein